MPTLEFYQNHLDQVSRSFAFCIKKLEGPFRKWVSLTYLICRILDTVEDSPWKRNVNQLKQFKKFDDSLTDAQASKLLNTWSQEFPEDIPQSEKQLLADSKLIFEDLHQYPESVKRIIQDTVLSMSRGMQHFITRKKKGELHLKNLYEVNQYCFFVAGVIGEALSKFLNLAEDKFNHSKQSLIDSYHFGLFLQKVNLLKDQMGDEQEGRYLIHSRIEVLASLQENAAGAYRYLNKIPRNQKGYRLFCAWSFFIGLASLPHIEKAYYEKSKHKIKRLETLRLINQVEVIINESDKIEYLYKKLMSKVTFPQMHEPLKQKMDLEWFMPLYKGQLKKQDLYQLKIF